MPRRKLKEPEAGSGILPPKKSMELRSVRDSRHSAKLVQKQANDDDKISPEPATKPAEEPISETKVPAKRGRKRIVKESVSPTPESAGANKTPKVPLKVPVKDIEKLPESDVKLPASPGKDIADGQTNGAKLSLTSPIDQSPSCEMPKVVLPPCRVLLEARQNPAVSSDIGVLETEVPSEGNNSVAPHTVPDMIGANEVVEKKIGGRKRRSKNETSDVESTVCKQFRSTKGPVPPTESPIPLPSKAKGGKTSSHVGNVDHSRLDITMMVDTAEIAEMVSENTRKRLHRAPSTVTAMVPTPSPICSKNPAAPKILDKPQSLVASLPLSVSKETFEESPECDTASDATKIPDGNKVPVLVGDVKPNIGIPVTAMQHSMTVNSSSVKVPPPTSNTPIRALADSTQCSPVTLAQPILLANPNVHSSIPLSHILPLSTSYPHKPFIPPAFMSLNKTEPTCPAPKLASSPLLNEVVMKPKAKPRRRRSAALVEDGVGDTEGARLLMRDWLYWEAERGSHGSGIEWYDRSHQMIKIAWKHASKTGWTERDSRVFVNWAKYTGRYDESEGHCKRWKANFRCAIHSLPDVQEIKLDKYSIVRSPGEQFKIYQLLPPAARKRSRGSSDSLPSPYRRMSSTKQEPDTSTSPLPQPDDESQLMEDEQAAQLISVSDLYAPAPSTTYPISPAVTAVKAPPETTGAPPLIVYCHQDQVPQPHGALNNPGLPQQIIYYIANPVLPTAPDHSYANGVTTATDVKPSITTVTAPAVKPPAPARQATVPPSSKPRNVMIPTMVEMLNLSSDEEEEMPRGVGHQLKNEERSLTRRHASDDESTSVITSVVAMPTQQPTSVVAMTTQQLNSVIAMTTQQLSSVAAMTTHQQPSFTNVLSPSASQPTSSLQQQESYHEMQPLQLTNQNAAFPAVSVVLNVDGVFDQDSPPRPTDLDDHFQHQLDLRSIFD